MQLARFGLYIFAFLKLDFAFAEGKTAKVLKPFGAVARTHGLSLPFPVQHACPHERRPPTPTDKPDFLRMIRKRLPILTIQRRPAVWLLLMALILGAGMPSCKSKQKAAERERQEMLAKQTAQAKEDLIGLLSDANTMSLEEKEKALQQIKDLGLDDPEVRDLIAKVENKLAEERAEMERAAAEQAAEQRDAVAKQAKQRALNSAFASIANASTPAAANLKIDETLRLFSSPDAPVLIIIAEVDGKKDYDRPTTIRKYLEHVKDTGSVEENLAHMRMDDNGNIAELELRKR